MRGTCSPRLCVVGDWYRLSAHCLDDSAWLRITSSNMQKDILYR